MKRPGQSLKGFSPLRLMGLFMALTSLAVGACSGRPPEADGSKAAGESEKTPASITILVYTLNWSKLDLPQVDPVFLSLFHEHGGELQGQLVKSWEKSEDATLWTYHLRTDVRWQDGVPVTAHDVKFTLELLGHPEVLTLPPSATTAEVVDDSTITIAFHRVGRDTWQPLEANFAILPKHLLEGLDPAEMDSWDFWSAPVGNGPYRVVRQTPQTMVELEANPDFFGEKPKIDRAILKASLGAPAWVQLQSGEVDAADLYALDVTDVRAVAADPGFLSYWTLTDWISHIRWNLGHPILRDPDIRRAISLAIDRAELAAAMDFPEDLPRYDVPVTARQQRRMDFPEPTRYDPEQAALLFEKAGWSAQDGDGIRERDGEELQFTILAAGGSLAVVIQAQLRRVGVSTEIVNMTRPAMERRMEEGRWGIDVSRSGAFLQVVLPMADSVWGYRNRTLSSLSESADRAVDPEVRDNLYRAMWPLVSEENPVTYLLPEGIPTIAHRRIRGLATPGTVSLTSHLHELWIEEDWEGEGKTESGAHPSEAGGEE